MPKPAVKQPSLRNIIVIIIIVIIIVIIIIIIIIIKFYSRLCHGEEFEPNLQPS